MASVKGRRRNIYVTNDRVNQLLDESPNFSKLIELAVLHYVDSREYMTREDCIELINSYIEQNGRKARTARPTTLNKGDLDDVMDL